jgi:hypothetical protein
MMNFVLPEEHTIFENEILSILTLLWTGTFVWRVLHVGQKLLILLECTPCFSGVRVAQSLVFYIVLCTSLFNFLLVIVLSDRLRFTASDYPFRTFKHCTYLTRQNDPSRWKWTLINDYIGRYKLEIKHSFLDTKHKLKKDRQHNCQKKKVKMTSNDLS